MSYSHFCFLTLLLFSTLNCNEVHVESKPNDSIVQDLVSKNQILLTNRAKFRNHEDEMNGASSFLIKYNQNVFAVTAKHLLGEAMDVQPEIQPTDLNKILLTWKMFPRIPIDPQFDTVNVNAKKLNYDSLKKDILLLHVEDLKSRVYQLTPNFLLPNIRDTYYLIGCPYSESECKQNIYPIIYSGFYEEKSMLTFTMASDVKIAGFSGAPIIDFEGKVVAVLTSGWREGNTNIVGGTFIGEIKNIQ